MAVNRTIPGTYVTINDQNLVFNTNNDNPNVFVLGTAAAGRTTPVQVGSYQQIRGAEYGDDGSLVDGLHLLETTAAQSVFAMRINSDPAMLQGVGGLQHRIQTVLEDGSAGTNYKVAYDASATRLQVVNELDTIVYDNNPLGTPVDTGEVIVRPVYTNSTIDVGVIDEEWVSLSDLGTAADIVRTAVVVGDTTTGGVNTATLTVAPVGTGVKVGSAVTISTPSVTVVASDAGAAASVAIATTSIANDTVTLTLTNGSVVPGSLVITDEQGATDVVWTDQGDGTLTGVGAGTLGNAVSATINYSTGAVSLVYDADMTGTTVVAANIDYQYYDGTLDTWTIGAVVSGANATVGANNAAAGSFNSLTGALVLNWNAGTEPADVVDVTMTYTYIFNPSWDVFYQAGRDGLDASRVEFFQSMQIAFDSLEATDVDVVLPVEATLDAPNVVEMTSGLITDPTTLEYRGLDFATLTPSSTYPTKGSLQDVLGKLYVEEYKGSKYHFWQFDHTQNYAQIVPQVFALDPAAQALIDTGQYSIAEAIKEVATTGSGTKFASTDFKEVNFAWETAYFCYKLEVNDNSATCVVGTEAPLSSLLEDINEWIGVPPTVNSAGAITVDGTGLRGNKFMAGTMAHGKGFWATDSGWLPVATDPSASTDVLTDDNDKPIQIGKYLSVTAMPVIPTSKSDVFGVGTAVSLHTIYGGNYGGVKEDYSLTNKRLQGIRLPFNLTKLQAEQLRDARYVTMINNRLGTVVVEDAIATTSASDFQNLTTIRIVTQLLEDIRDDLSEFIGDGLTDAKIVSAQTAVNAILSAYQKAGKITKGVGQVIVTQRDRVAGRMRVVLNVSPAFQLKIISLSLSLELPQA